VTDRMGRLWKIEKNAFICYTKRKGDTNVKDIHHTLPDMMIPAGKHETRGKGCGGDVFGPKGFRICSKCGGEIHDAPNRSDRFNRSDRHTA
jgi:hypothetical protein